MFDVRCPMVDSRCSMFDSHPEISARNSMSKNDLRAIIAYARSKGLEVIPEVKFLTHQQNLLANSHRELLLNGVTYDPNKPEVYKIVFSVINEIIDLFHPKYFHIGHDEMREHYGKNPDENSKLPSYKDYASDANKIAAYLRNKKITTIMWGDMMLNPNFFAVRNKTDFNGGVQDYYKAVDILDKDIIIVDWHYYAYETTFPTADYFLSKGFKVLGSTWKDKTTIKNFSHYVCSKNNLNAMGMIATTWFLFNNRNTDTIGNIVDVSSKAFAECNE